jgi:hypothetical protein
MVIPEAHKGIVKTSTFPKKDKRKGGKTAAAKL